MTSGRQVSPAISFLATAVESYAPYLQESGELHDPVFGAPTQYGTAYHMLCHAVLAAHGAENRRETHLNRAVRGLDAALRHTSDPFLPPGISSVDEATGSVVRLNHRDFTWPPILKAYRILRDLGHSRTDEFAERIAAVDIERSFFLRPPSNWASVWLSGEWIRICEGLSPYDASQFDDWIGAYFDGITLVDLGLYQEPGLSNSYDLFARYHLADILAEEYDGNWLDPMRRLLSTGLERSLGVQLSDGSMASAQRSTGQTWTVGAQIAFFTAAAAIQGSSEAAAAAQRGFESLRRWQRADGPFSPVENCLPPGYRVGYEEYTADAHYANLALGFLAAAVLRGFTGAEDEARSQKRSLVRAEGAPTHRALTHDGDLSVHVNAAPHPSYDGFGITDLTFGPGRILQFASTVQHVASGAFFNLGLACRRGPGLDSLTVAAQQRLTLAEPIVALDSPPGLRLRATGTELRSYGLDVTVDAGVAHIQESTPGLVNHKTLLVPYLRDPGTGVVTDVEIDGSALHLNHGDEHLVIAVNAEVEHILHLPYGYQNRRGLCGLIRLDLRMPAEVVTYTVAAHLP